MLVGLSRLNSNKFKSLLNRRKHFDPSNVSIKPKTDKSENLVINEFDDVAVIRLEHPYRKDFPYDDVERIVSGYQSGMTTIELGEQFCCHKGTINKLLRQHGVNVTKSKAQAKLDIKVVIAMYKGRHTSEEIAKHFGVSSQAVSKYLHDNEVKIRSRWDYVTK